MKPLSLTVSTNLSKSFQTSVCRTATPATCSINSSRKKPLNTSPSLIKIPRLCSFFQILLLSKASNNLLIKQIHQRNSFVTPPEKPLQKIRMSCPSITSRNNTLYWDYFIQNTREAGGTVLSSKTDGSRNDRSQSTRDANYPKIHISGTPEISDSSIQIFAIIRILRF